MARGAAAVVKLLCIEWLQGNVGESVAENASSVLEAKGKTLVCMSMCASDPAAYESLCECFSLPLQIVIYMCVCVSYLRQGMLPPSELLLLVEGCEGGPLV